MDVSGLSENEFISLFKQLGEQKDIYIFGAGTYGNIAGKIFYSNNICWKGYIDNNSNLYKKIMNGKEVLPFNEKIREGAFLLCARCYAEIYNQLIANGVREEDIYWLKNTVLLEKMWDGMTVTEEYTNKIKSFKGIHKDKRCFIIGNGPSLQIDDLEKIKNEYSMAVNKIFQLYDKTSWRPTYYLVEDPYMMRTVFPEKTSFLSVVNESVAGFTSTRRKIFEYRNDADMKKVFFYKARTNAEVNNIGFSEDCSEYVYTDCSSTYILLQLAVYMGFSRIYLVGIDHSYSLERNLAGKVIKTLNIQNHAQYIDDNNFKEEAIPELERFELGYQAARRYAERNNIKIYNATRGGKLEVFERINIDSLFR